jgi:hypothetical protein
MGRPAIDRSRVLAEIYPGAANDLAAHVANHDDWVCEAHPEKPWKHDGCPAPGMPPEG